MGKKLEFFYDCSSPWTYLAFSKIEDVARRHHANLLWRPFLVGGVFNTVNPSVYESRAKPVKLKARYYTKDLQDWARFYGLKIGNPSVFPVNSVKAMRGALVAEEMERSRRTRGGFLKAIGVPIATSVRTKYCATLCARSASTNRNTSRKLPPPITRPGCEPIPSS